MIRNKDYKLHYNNLEQLGELTGVYLLRNSDNNKLKIGSTNNLNNRIKDIESNFRFCGIIPKLKAECFIEYPAKLSLERFLHKQLKDYNHTNEWFNIKDIQIVIDKLTDYKAYDISSSLKSKYKSIWNSMIKRAEKYNYIICEDWKKYKNFELWIHENYYSDCGSETLIVNKDIINNNNSIYSPETSILIPRHLNNMILSNCTLEKDSKELYRFKYKKVYFDYISDITNANIISEYIYKTEDEAIKEYEKSKKENVIDLLKIYTDCIPNDIYNLILSKYM